MILDHPYSPPSIVKILDITNIDGIKLAPLHMRSWDIGTYTTCKVVGGLKSVTLFFEMQVEKDSLGIKDIDIDWKHTSTEGPKFPVEILPNIFIFADTQYIYKLEVIEGEEEREIVKALEDTLNHSLKPLLVPATPETSDSPSSHNSAYESPNVITCIKGEPD